MEKSAKNVPAQLWEVQVKLGSLIFLFDHFQSDAYQDDDQPLSGIAKILREVQTDLDWIREKFEGLNL